MTPAEPEQVIAHGFGQITHVAVGFDGKRTMAFGELRAIGAMDQRHMAIDRHRPAHRLNDLQLPGRIVEMIGAAQHMGDSHVEIVDHNSQHIGRRAVAS